MPELPDVEIYRKRMDKACNKKIIDIQVNENRIVKVNTKKLHTSLSGKIIQTTHRRGKYMISTMNNGDNLILHFGMTGELQYLPQDEAEPEYTKFKISFKNQHIIYYISKRKLGFIDVCEDTGRYFRKHDIGRDALEIDKDTFRQYIHHKKSMLKGALTDQSSLAGIGNIYADEILFQSGLHPKKKASKLSTKDIDRLYKMMHDVCRTAIEYQAQPSEFPDHYLIPNRSEGYSCPNCHDKIKKIKVNGRSTFFCPKCQVK
jgi:formamidopyrimidine-DNA glycosylase